MRNALLLLLGLAIGVAATYLIQGSILPTEGTPEAKILALEQELTDTRLRLAKIDPAQARAREDSGNALSEGARAALADLKAGRPVDMNHLYQAVKPLMRDLSPLFDTMRRKEERRMFERITGEMTRKYNLTGPQQEALQAWLKQRAEENNAKFKALTLADGTTLEDLTKATRDIRPDDGLDAFMATQLSGSAAENFKRDRLTERADRVQHEADAKVTRLNSTVGLDDTQQDQVFSIMARSSKDFDPQMQLEGVSSDAPAATDRDAAIFAVLRPDQQRKYDEWKVERRMRKEQEMAEMGFKMPANWDALNGDY